MRRVDVGEGPSKLVHRVRSPRRVRDRRWRRSDRCLGGHAGEEAWTRSESDQRQIARATWGPEELCTDLGALALPFE
eukprot:scaffold1295_cov220-Pinguiococcus_pyrenoidosus.AAC.17